jgi:iron(III) transport system substrate-binding protein
MKRAIILILLVAVVGLPFLLRPAGHQRLAATVDDTVVVISPHTEAIRDEFGSAFARWYLARTGRTVAVDWRTIGGTTEIARYLDGSFTGSFRQWWTVRLGRAWDSDIEAGYANPKLPADAPGEAREARAAFLASEAGCGLDVFFGGGTPDFVRQAQAGRLVDSGVMRLHPEWFGPAAIPASYAGEDYRDPDGRWIGSALSAFGLVFNRDELARRGLAPPTQWADLQDPRYFGGVALADPTKSGSVAKAFENVIQQQMQARLAALTPDGGATNPRPTGAAEATAVAAGWLDGLHLLQVVAANARYFTDSAQKVPVDVAAGDCAAGMCIDFYGRQQAEAVERRAASDRVGYVSPVGGTVPSADPIGLLRGAPHRAAAVAFIEFVLSPEGQRLWNLRPGTAGGPERYALRRLPIRRDFYADTALAALRSDPGESPFTTANQLVYRRAWTGDLFRELTFIVRVMAIDPHDELREAWRAIIAAGQPPEALAAMRDLSPVDYAAAGGRIRQALESKDRADEIHLATELGEAFRAQYLRARELALAHR